MATASKKSADYDPIEEALDIGYGVGRSEERKRRTEHVERARRGGQRKGRAEANKILDTERRERAQRADAVRARSRRVQEERTASARRGAYRAGQADIRRAQADAARQARPSSSSGTAAPAPQLRAPNFNLPGGSLGNGPDRTTTARIILVATAISAIGVVTRDTITGGVPSKTTVKVGNETVTVPTHLRSLGGVFIMGTIALVVNEVNPGIGLTLGVVLLLDVGVSTLTGRGGLFNSIGNGLFAKTVPGAAGSSTIPPGPHTGNDWYAPGNPGNPNGVKLPQSGSGSGSGLKGGKSGAGGGGGGGGSF